jgi:hypothetical protein
MPPQNATAVELQDYRDRKKWDTVATTAMDAVFVNCGALPSNEALSAQWNALASDGLDANFMSAYGPILFQDQAEADNMARWPLDQLQDLGRRVVATCQHFAALAASGQTRDIQFRWYLDKGLKQEFIHCICDSEGFVEQVHLMSPDDAAHVKQKPDGKWCVLVNP